MIPIQSERVPPLPPLCQGRLGLTVPLVVSGTHQRRAKPRDVDLARKSPPEASYDEAHERD